MHDSERWQEWLAESKKDKHSVYLGMGDYDDAHSASERIILANPGLHESTRKNHEAEAMFRVTRLVKELSFMKGRLLGLVEGNHYSQFSDGTTSTQRMCEKLGCRYLGVMAVIRMTLTISSNHRLVCDVFAHHGKGAARLLGGSLNRVQQMAEGMEADLYVMGHDHKLSMGKTVRFRLRTDGKGAKLQERKVIFARSGSFLKGFEPGEVSYAADSCMTPNELGGTLVKIRVKYHSPSRTYQIEYRGEI